MSEEALPNNLTDWKEWFLDRVHEARCAVMSEDDRDELIKFVRENAELIFYGPVPESEAQDCEPREPWWDR